MKKFLESPFAGKHPKLISKGIKAAAAEAAVTAAEAIAVADLEEAKRLAAQFEALGGGSLTMAPIKFLRSLQYSYALILNAITTSNLSSEFISMVNAIPG
jgi:hypothetical protein